MSDQKHHLRVNSLWCKKSDIYLYD